MHIGPLTRGDALAYLTVAIDTLSALATSSSAVPGPSDTDAGPAGATTLGGVAASQLAPTAPPLSGSGTAPPSAPPQPLQALRQLPSLLFATIRIVGQQDADEDEGGAAVLPRVFTTPFNRFQLVHCYAHEHAVADASHEPDKQDVYALMRTSNRFAPHYLTDYVTAAAATRAALAGLDATLRSGTSEGSPGESIRDMLRRPRMLAKIRVQMAERGACAQQAVSLLASALVAEPTLAAEFHAQVCSSCAVVGVLASMLQLCRCVCLQAHSDPGGGSMRRSSVCVKTTLCPVSLRQFRGKVVAAVDIFCVIRAPFEVVKWQWRFQSHRVFVTHNYRRHGDSAERVV